MPEEYNGGHYGILYGHLGIRVEYDKQEVQHGRPEVQEGQGGQCGVQYDILEGQEGVQYGILEGQKGVHYSVLEVHDVRQLDDSDGQEGHGLKVQEREGQGWEHSDGQDDGHGLKVQERKVQEQEYTRNSARRRLALVYSWYSEYLRVGRSALVMLVFQH